LCVVRVSFRGFEGGKIFGGTKEADESAMEARKQGRKEGRKVEDCFIRVGVGESELGCVCM